MVPARDSLCQPALSDASFHYTRICSLALTATGINSKQPTFPFPEEYESCWQRWKREIITAKPGELCALSWGELGFRGEVLLTLNS